MRFQDAGFVQHDADEAIQIEMLEHFVIRDGDAWLYFVVSAAILDRNTKFGGFFDGLLRHAQRSGDDDVSARMLTDAIRPCDLAQRLAESGIEEKRSAATLERPLNASGLKIEQRADRNIGINPVGTSANCFDLIKSM